MGSRHDGPSLGESWLQVVEREFARGRYLQIDPMFSAVPQYSGLPAYAYAANNPINKADPTGLFIRHGDCPNWQPALQLARAWAGCGPVCNKDAPCQKKIASCTGSAAGGKGCDICEILTDGKRPDAFIVEGPLKDEQGNPREFRRASTALIIDEETGVILVDRTEFLKSTCYYPGLVSNLARYMIHEAAHVCSEQAWIHISDQSGQCSADAIEAACR